MPLSDHFRPPPYNSRYRLASMGDGRESLITHVMVTRGQPTWRIIVLADIIFVGLSLITYLEFLIWIHDNNPVRHGSAKAFDEASSQTSRRGAYTHFSTCAFAVLLLLQAHMDPSCCFSRPENEIENAHSRDRWLHIGVGGLRNMRRISKRRLIRPILLVANSLSLPFL